MYFIRLDVSSEYIGAIRTKTQVRALPRFNSFARNTIGVNKRDVNFIGALHFSIGRAITGNKVLLAHRDIRFKSRTTIEYPRGQRVRRSSRPSLSTVSCPMDQLIHSSSSSAYYLFSSPVCTMVEKLFGRDCNPSPSPLFRSPVDDPEFPSRIEKRDPEFLVISPYGTWLRRLLRVRRLDTLFA